MSTRLKVGDALPSVGLRATDGYLLNLRSWVTRQPVLLLFFAGPSLSGEAERRGTEIVAALSEGYSRLRDVGIAAVAISVDSQVDQAAYASKLKLPFLLLSDERRSAVELLGIETKAANGNVNVARPVAMAVDHEGIIRAVIDPIDPPSLVDRAIRSILPPVRRTTEEASVAS
ncbi:MAG: redoxin domain-containing protein [Chloroflexi bacterium]|nr:redoxin domain-containing protein [Chloroflexota bacterium]